MIKLLALIITILSIPWQGYVLCRLWDWFLIPLNAPAIELWHMCGLALFLQYAVVRHNFADLLREKYEDQYLIINVTVKAVLGPALILLFGCIFSSLM